MRLDTILKSRAFCSSVSMAIIPHSHFSAEAVTFSFEVVIMVMFN